MIKNQAEDNSIGADKDEETIGHVSLDLSAYPGSDLYSDGAVEDELLEIARDRSEAEYPQIIEESASWPILYHLSHIRENIVSWLPIDNTMKVLEIGAGCGAITGALCRLAGRVDCVDLSLKRSRINAYRHMYSDNLTIHVGNFTDVEKQLPRDYDYILLIGVFEYAQSYVNTKDPYADFLNIIKKHLKDGGSIAIAIENRLGLKYWAGCAEDHLGTYFSSLENYPDGGIVRTFSNKGLIDIAVRCGFKSYKMYYPYPDYKFPVNIYSDERMPRLGELKNNLRNFDRARYLLFDEKNVFDSLIGEDLFGTFSNSYMLILGNTPDIDYVRFSNDRLRKYRISTTQSHENGERTILKAALTEEAKAHIRDYANACEKLTEEYKNSGLSINKAVLNADGSSVSLEYIDGETLEAKLDRCVMQGDESGFEELFKEYLERISFTENTVGLKCFDLIFSNIIIDGDKWTVIDYEWTTDERLSVKEIAFRALYCYILEDERRNKLNLDSIMQLIGVDDKMASELREDEMRFQKKITGNHKSLEEIREAIGNPVIRPGVGESRDERSLNMRPQIYEDTGRGFNEDESFFVEEVPIRVTIPHGRRALRLDPCSQFCIVTVNSIKWNGAEIACPRKGYLCNGTRIGTQVYAFSTSDPGFTIPLKGMSNLTENVFEADFTVTALDADTAGRIGRK